jgi:DNA-binding transcriptional LysR family regulator
MCTGIIYATEPVPRPYLDGGAFKPVLDTWATTGSGFHIYHIGRRHLPKGLRLLIDLIREVRPLPC